MMTRPAPSRIVAVLLMSWICSTAHPSAAAHRFSEPDAARDKQNLWVIEFDRTAPDSLPGNIALTPVTERIALSRVDPRALPQPRVPLWQRNPYAVRRVERNIPFFVAAGAALPPHARRDLRRTQPTNWSRLSAPSAGLFALPQGRRARIGIIDTGLDYSHPDLAGNVGAGVNFLRREAGLHTPSRLPSPLGAESEDSSEMDYNGHGTLVAGIIGARHNEFGIDGVATSVELLGLKSFDRHGTGHLSDILQAVAWAGRNNVDILNMSFGTHEHSEILEEALQKAAAGGMVLVAAAGNDGVAAATFPASLPCVTAVGALGLRGVGRMSNHGPNVDLYAPGHEVMSTTSRMLGPQVYSTLSGSSAAAAVATGVLAQTMLHGKTAGDARSWLQERLVMQPGPADTNIAALYAPGVLSDLQARAYTALALTGLRAQQQADATLGIAWRIQNVGNRPTPADMLMLRVWQEQAQFEVPGGALPPLAPGASFTGTTSVALPRGWVTPKDTSAGVEARLDGGNLQHATPVSAALSAAPKARIQVGSIRVSPTRHAGPRMMHVQLRNAGNAAAAGLSLRGFGIPATHEGIWSVPRHAVTPEVPADALPAGEQMEAVLPLDGAMPETDAWTWLVEVMQDGVQVERAIQSWEALPGGQVQLHYNQAAHMAMVETAVDLLRLQNILLPDLHDPGAPFLGSSETARDWGSALNVGMSRWRWDWAGDWPAYPQSARHLIDGASAADGIDVAYGDTGVSTWDTHYWIVDEGDGAGLGEVSALHKIYALITGGWGSSIQDGAIAAYKAGDKARAWWLVGHAAHLLGDLSTGAHTINRNWHGVVGDPYHDWMGRHYHAWPATVPYAMGGFIDPYRSDLLGTPERLRFLAYTVARIGASFPWHQKRGWIPGVQGARSGDGSRGLHGDAPHYDAYMRDWFAGFAAHPLLERDISKEEAMTVWNVCIAVDELEDMQYLADCWDGGDGHIDRNNILYDDIDGDLSRVADQAYTYGVRAIAGMLVLFGIETGQLSPDVLLR